MASAKNACGFIRYKSLSALVISATSCKFIWHV